MIILLMMSVLILALIFRMDIQKENWDFDDFPDMCRRKLKKEEKELKYINTPHFGGVPSQSEVWM